MTQMENKVDKSTFTRALQSIEFHDMVVQVFKNNLVMVSFRNNCAIGVHHLKNAMDAAQKLVNKPQCKVLVYIEPGVVYTPEGKAYSFSTDHLKHKLAWAAVSNSGWQIFINNLSQKMKGSNVPFRMFKRVDEAMDWLESA